MSHTKRITGGERGASVVEFAIILPLFLLLIGGMVDLGRAFYTEVMLTNAAREGARSAMYSQTPSVTLKRAQDAGGNNPNFTAAVTASCPATPTSPPSNATVTVTDSNFQWIILGPAMNIITFGSGSALPTTLSGEATMQCGG